MPELSRSERADMIADPAEIIAIDTVRGVEEAEETGWWNSYTPDIVQEASRTTSKPKK
ncbi:hypothetical protein [Saccharopolyspora shandongensis]|uniref:hypothetical protein n=1 Tax=Saccharopolyspora shandongensis TaxID=418495 RepID=UPI0033FC7EE7